MNDPLLLQLVKLAESLDELGAGVPTITLKLNIHGQVVTGTILSLKKYVAHIKKSSLQAVFIKADARNILDENKLNQAILPIAPAGATDCVEHPLFLLLSESGETWRFRLCDVSGFSIVG
jgi:hypothetical protein